MMVLADPSPVSAFGQSTLSLKGRGQAPSALSFLLPLREKVPEGRMRGSLHELKPTDRISP
jgi:hypothetical protein